MPLDEDQENPRTQEDQVNQEQEGKAVLHRNTPTKQKTKQEEEKYCTAVSPQHEGNGKTIPGAPGAHEDVREEK